MGAIKIKGINSSIVITLAEGQWLTHTDEFKQQLRLLADHGLHCTEVFFDSLPDENQLLLLYDLLAEQGCVITSVRLSHPIEEDPSWTMITEPLRSGDIQEFTGSTILIRNIRKTVCITQDAGDLVVLGSVSGQINLKDRSGRLFCMGLDHVRIKIADSDWQELTDSAKVCVYYENQKCCCLRLEEKGSWENVL